MPREAWYNWKTGYLVTLDAPPADDETAREYIPQTMLAANHYQSLRDAGVSPADAATQTVALYADGAL